MQLTEKMQQNFDLKEESKVLYPSFEGKSMIVEITNKCNQKCVYCSFYIHGMHKNGKDVDEELFYRVAKEGRELGVADFGIYITGEALMNPKVYDYIRYLKKDLQFPYVYLSTNGILCTPKNLEKLIDAGLDSLKFSIDSADKENFEKHHGVNAFDLVYDNVKYAYEYRKANNLDYKLFIESVVTRYNQHEKQAIKDMYGPFVDQVMFVNVHDGFVKISGVSEYLMVEGEDDFPGCNEVPCSQIFNRIIVDVDGYLCSCCIVDADYVKVANLSEMSLKEAVYCDDMVNLRRRHLNNDLDNIVCNRCVNGVVETIKPLTDKYGFEDINLEVIEHEDEIKRRFDIK